MIQDKRKKRVTILSLIGMVFLIILVSKIYHGFLQNQQAFDEDLPPTYKLSSEDSNLISNNYRQKLKVIEVFRSKVRNSISLVSVGENYRLIIYKIDSTKTASLKDILKTEIKSVDRSTGYTYTILGNDIPYKFQYKSGIESRGAKIYLTLAGDSLNTVEKSDSIFSYHLICKNISIRYDENAPIDIFIGGKEVAFGNTDTIPMDVLFLKRNRSVYLLLLTSDNPKSLIPNNLLYDIVMGN
jgi:hypothetical protein